MSINTSMLSLFLMWGCIDGGKEIGDLIEVDMDGDGVPLGNDCDDNDPLVTEEYQDYYHDGDGDGYGAGARYRSCVVPVGYVPNGNDCDDGDDTIHPFASELCDGIVTDCNILNSNPPNYIPPDEKDDDGDGYVECEYDANIWRGASITGGDDCDDSNSSTYPFASELCDGLNNDCDNDAQEMGLEIDDDGDRYVECLGWEGSNLSIDGGNDCDDNDPLIYPTALEEAGDEIDQNCDGNELCYQDKDSDGQANEDTTVTVLSVQDLDCGNYGIEALAGAPMTDCNDNDATIYDGALDTWYDGIDSNCDGANDFDQDGDGEDSSDHGGIDCNDLDPAINTSATEVWYDGVDQDCSGGSDYDQDGDGENSSAHGGIDCDDTNSLTIGDQDGDGFTSCTDDCDDMEFTVNPDATEIWYDGVDQNCDGLSDYDQDGDGEDASAHGGYDCDDTDSSVGSILNDQDCDGVLTADDCDDNNATLLEQANDQDCDGSLTSDDCDDNNPTIYPSAPELCDGIVNDCDDPNYGTPNYVPPNESDDDSDGYVECENWEGSDPSIVGGDCDDVDPNINPGADEVCDGVDNNCNTLIDDGDPNDPNDGDLNNIVYGPGLENVWFEDNDGDGVGVYTTNYFYACQQPIGRVQIVDDCDDSNPNIYPDFTDDQGNLREADEVCNDLDDDCDGLIDDDGNGVPSLIDPDTVYEMTDRWYEDVDGDNYGNPNNGYVEACNPPANRVNDDTDCDDLNSREFPGANSFNYPNMNFCDGIVNDCNDSNYGNPNYIPPDEKDDDGDGYVECEYDANIWEGPSITGGDDCDDNDPNINPGAQDISVDGVDQDCNNIDGPDVDGDGYVDVDAGGDDCNDNDPNINPDSILDQGFQPNGNPSYDNIDSDCDGLDHVHLGADDDGDGYSIVDGDCDDNDSAIHPGTSELPGNTIDEDCDGYYQGALVLGTDNDGDGYTSDLDCDDNDGSVYPFAPKLSDGKDNDCDGLIDVNVEYDATTDLEDYDCDPSIPEQLCITVWVTEEGLLDVLNDPIDNSSVSTFNQQLEDWSLATGSYGSSTDALGNQQHKYVRTAKYLRTMMIRDIIEVLENSQLSVNNHPDGTSFGLQFGLELRGILPGMLNDSVNPSVDTVAGFVADSLGFVEPSGDPDVSDLHASYGNQTCPFADCSGWGTTPLFTYSMNDVLLDADIYVNSVHSNKIHNSDIRIFLKENEGAADNHPGMRDRIITGDPDFDYRSPYSFPRTASLPSGMLNAISIGDEYAPNYYFSSTLGYVLGGNKGNGNQTYLYCHRVGFSVMGLDRIRYDYDTIESRCGAVRNAPAGSFGNQASTLGHNQSLQNLQISDQEPLTQNVYSSISMYAFSGYFDWESQNPLYPYELGGGGSGYLVDADGNVINNVLENNRCIVETSWRYVVGGATADFSICTP